MRQFEQPIGLSTHGREDHDHLMAVLAGMLDTISHTVNAFDRPDGGPAVFLDNQCHDSRPS
jgi:hypothetical protein